jgi:hypothetical protein
MKPAGLSFRADAGGCYGARMRTLPRRTAWALAAIWILAGCASTAPPARKAPAARASDAAPYDFKREGTVPAVTEADARAEVDAAIEETPVTQETIEVSDTEAPPPDTTRAAAALDSMADGFRVQVFASADRDVAENARAVAEQRLRMPGYLELEAGVYKVRVGDFPARAAAEASLAAVRREYADAWIVPSRVIVRGAQTP